MNHRKPYNLIRPYCASQSAHFDEKNIFMDSLDELSLRQDSDRYIVGLKDVRIYKNKLKRKQKLTPAVPVIMKQLSETESMKISNSLLTGQQVIDCLPKADSSIILRQKSRKGIRAFHSKNKIEWDTKGKMLGISSKLMESVHQYRELVEKRQQSSRMNGLSFKKCEEWAQNLRETKKRPKGEKIFRPSKMMACGMSKKKAEGLWLREKENEGYLFQLIPSTFIDQSNKILKKS